MLTSQCEIFGGAEEIALTGSPELSSEGYQVVKIKVDGYFLKIYDQGRLGTAKSIHLQYTSLANSMYIYMAILFPLAFTLSPETAPLAMSDQNLDENLSCNEKGSNRGFNFGGLLLMLSFIIY